MLVFILVAGESRSGGHPAVASDDEANHEEDEKHEESNEATKVGGIYQIIERSGRVRREEDGFGVRVQRLNSAEVALSLIVESHSVTARSGGDRESLDGVHLGEGHGQDLLEDVVVNAGGAGRGRERAGVAPTIVPVERGNEVVHLVIEANVI